MNMSDPVMAALIGASATLATALFQLLVNARRQAAERAAGKPVSRKSGNWLAILALMLAAAVVGLPPCVNSLAASAASAGCNEGSALHASVCATIPATATVTEVQVFTRFEDSQQAWSEVRVQAGQDAGSAKFVDAFYERAQADAKEVCQHFVHWNSQKGRVARILVTYVL